jgi:hypothetical protein
VAVLEHFYASLCGLVEWQRISDPLTLMMVHKVRADDCEVCRLLGGGGV